MKSDQTNIKKIIFWGGTGQSKVMRPIAENMGLELIAVFDDTIGLKPPFEDVALFSGTEGFKIWKEKQEDISDVGFCVTIGNPNGRRRIEISEYLERHELIPLTLIHPTAIISKTALIGKGCQIQSYVIVDENSVVGDYCILNNRSSIDHDCKIGRGVELSPSATLCGEIKVKDFAWICAGATVLPGCEIGEDSILAGGALLRDSMPNNSLYCGVPAQYKKAVRTDINA